MKIYLSADIEGTTGIASWEETSEGHVLYEYFVGQMTREVAAACEGAIAAGAGEILVKDAHGCARNIKPDLLPEQVKIFRGWGKNPLMMMAGIDQSFDGVVFTGYHSAAGMNTNPLAHTMNNKNNYVKINGETMSELMMNSLTAAYFGVPVFFVAGDEGLCAWIQSVNANITTIPVNIGFGDGAISIHPALAVKRIRSAVEEALKKPKMDCMFPLPKDFSVEISYKQHQLATHASNYPGCKLTGTTSVTYETDDYMDVLRMLYWVL